MTDKQTLVVGLIPAANASNIATPDCKTKSTMHSQSG